MSPSVVVVIHGDPLKTHRPVEALRIALGLSTGDNPLTVVLLGRSPLLLTDETGELMDAEIGPAKHRLVHSPQRHPLSPETNIIAPVAKREQDPRGGIA